MKHEEVGKYFSRLLNPARYEASKPLLHKYIEDYVDWFFSALLDDVFFLQKSELLFDAGFLLADSLTEFLPLYFVDIFLKELYFLWFSIFYLEFYTFFVQ